MAIGRLQKKIQRDTSSSAGTRQMLVAMFEAMNGRFGDLKWWPGESPFEIALGAILTQNTNWKNVEYAIDRLKEAGLLCARRLHLAEQSRIADVIRPAGYYNVKAQRLKNFLEFLHGGYGGTMEAMRHEDTRVLRKKLLAVKGIGEETADSILLYALDKCVFVVDAYTRRILENHGLVERHWKYEAIQKLFMDNIPPDSALYNQYHALIVETAKRFCGKRPKCSGCPLENMETKNIR